jgi:hypothetical protein
VNVSAKKIKGTYRSFFAIARGRRAAFQHIPDFQNRGFLVRRMPCEIPV